jgi:peptidoglycan hydrolase CwlO-like protein
MEETVKLEMTKEESQQFQALIEECLAQMRQSIERIDRDQDEIERLKAETREMLNQIEATLNVETVL